jgi:hypothetical protein
MSIKAVYATKEEIPQQFLELFEEYEGTYRLVKIEGIKTDADVNRIQVGLTKERAEHTALKARFSALLGGRTVEEVHADLDRLPELEAAVKGGIDQEKIDALVNAKIATKLAPVERERDLFKTQVNEFGQKISIYENQNKQRVIHDSVRKACLDAKVLSTAQEDVLMLAERMFEINEDGSVTAKDGVGVTPGVRPEVWLTEMQNKRPHWWPISTGGGAKGSGSGSGFANNPFAKDTFNLTEQGQLLKTNPTLATQMAQAAGVKI